MLPPYALNGALSMGYLRALTNPAHAWQRARHYGVGRVVIDQAKSVPALLPATFAALRAAKIAADPLGYAQRRRLAETIKASSPFAGYFPEDTAFRAVPPGTFPEVDAAVVAARSVYKKFLDTFPEGRKADRFAFYILNDWSDQTSGDEDNMVTDLTLYPEFHELACARPLVDMAAGYLGEYPILGNIGLQIVSPNERTEGFQQFHIDRISKRQLKVFVAVEDVDEGNGATMVLPADKTEVVRAQIRYRSGRIADADLHAATPLDQLLRAKGKAGTTFLFDPCRVIHAGARTRTHRRVLLMLQYVSKYAHAESNLQRGLIKFDREKAGATPQTSLLFALK